MLEALERFKRSGYYAVQLHYGEDIGCDDMAVPAMDRRVVLFAHPVGCVGETRVCWSGKLSGFLEFDFTAFPTVLANDNPGGRRKALLGEEGGWFIWGIPKTVEYLRDTVWKDLQGKKNV